MAAVWERQPEESQKAYEAFLEYLKLPPDERSLEKAAKQRGRNTSLFSRWSSRWSWVERAQAWDDYNNNLALTVRTATLADAQRAQMQRTSLASTLIMDFILQQINDMRQQYDKGEPVDSRALQRLVRSFNETDTVSRRNLNMPTSYKSETVDEPEAEGEVYYIGGD